MENKNTWIKLENGGLYFSRNMDAEKFHTEFCSNKHPERIVPELAELNSKRMSLWDEMGKFENAYQTFCNSVRTNSSWEVIKALIVHLKEIGQEIDSLELASFWNEFETLKKRESEIYADRSIPEVKAYFENLEVHKQMREETFVKKGLSKAGTFVKFEDGSVMLIGNISEDGTENSYEGEGIDGKKVVEYMTLPQEYLSLLNDGVIAV